MSVMNVFFEVPSRIQQGLNDGTMRLFGGVVRNLNGGIVAHLSPGKLMTDAMNSGTPLDPSALTTAIGHVQSAAFLASAIGTVNLAVNAACFAMMLQRLNAIMGQLDRIQESIRDLKRDVKRLVSIHRSEVRGDIDSACDLASRAIRLHDQNLFKEARTSAHRVRRRMVHALRDILAEERVILRRQEFSELASACVILANVEASCDESIEGAKQAAIHLTATTDELLDLVKQFEAQCRDYSVDTAERIRLGPRCAKELGAITADIRNAIEGLRILAGEMTFRGLLGISLDRWRETTAPEGSSWITCVVPADTAEPELLAATEASARRAGS